MHLKAFFLITQMDFKVSRQLVPSSASRIKSETKCSTYPVNTITSSSFWRDDRPQAPDDLHAWRSHQRHTAHAVTEDPSSSRKDPRFKRHMGSQRWMESKGDNVFKSQFTLAYKSGCFLASRVDFGQVKNAGGPFCLEVNREARIYLIRSTKASQKSKGKTINGTGMCQTSLMDQNTLTYFFNEE